MKLRVENHIGKLFLLLLLLVFLFLNFQHFIFLHPTGPHFVRQTDSFAFVDYYQNNGFRFFEPGGWYLGNSNGRTAAEFPVLYYLTAVLGYFIGHENLVLRCISLLCISIGFYHLFKLLNLHMLHRGLAMGFTFLFLSSTVLLYYSINFLPDASALGLTLSAWYFAIRSYKTKNRSDLKRAFLFFGFASLLKITFVIHPVAFVMTAFLHDVVVQQTMRFRNFAAKAMVFYLVCVLMALAAWYGYAEYYNTKFDSNVFLSTFTPIWDLSKQQIDAVLLAVSHDWFSSYYYQTTFHVFLAIIVVGLVLTRYKKIDFHALLVIVLGAGTLVYFFLFFKQFKDHDYYMLNAAPFVFFLITFMFIQIVNRIKSAKVTKFLTTGVCVLSVLSFNYAAPKLSERFSKMSPVFERNVPALRGIDRFLDANGIPKSAKFLVVTEPNFNGAFYFMKRSGWNIKETNAEGKNEISKRLLTSDYLLVNELDELHFVGKGTPTLTYNGLYIYKISDLEKL